MIFLRVMRGEESLITAYIVTGAVISGYFLYDYMVPSYSDFFHEYFRVMGVLLMTWAATCLHASCAMSPLIPRLLTRAVVILLFMVAGINLAHYFGPWWAVGYLLLATSGAFFIKFDGS